MNSNRLKINKPQQTHALVCKDESDPFFLKHLKSVTAATAKIKFDRSQKLDDFIPA
jgi:hypothetical protein